MKEYTTVYIEDFIPNGQFSKTIHRSFENAVNALASEGWVVKFSNIATIPSTDAVSAGMAVYALMEREIEEE